MENIETINEKIIANEKKAHSLFVLGKFTGIPCHLKFLIPKYLLLQNSHS